MVCLEVAVNGRRQCVAGLDGPDSYLCVKAMHIHANSPQGRHFAGTRLRVSGSSDRVGWASWIDELELDVGDVVEVRFTEASEADPPTRLEEPSPEWREPQEKRLDILMALEAARGTSWRTLNPLRTTLSSLIWWMILVFLGVIIWNLSTVLRR